MSLTGIESERSCICVLDVYIFNPVMYMATIDKFGVWLAAMDNVLFQIDWNLKTNLLRKYMPKWFCYIVRMVYVNIVIETFTASIGDLLVVNWVYWRRVNGDSKRIFAAMKSSIDAVKLQNYK